MMDFEIAMQRALRQVWDEDDASGLYVISYDMENYLIIHEEDPQAYAPEVEDRYFVEAFFGWR